MSREYPCVYYDNEKCTKFCVDGVTSYCVKGIVGPCKYQILSNADRIRAMSDEELAEFLNQCTSDNGPKFCRSLPECDADLDVDTLIPLERCGQCLLYWLRQPAEEADHGV